MGRWSRHGDTILNLSHVPSRNSRSYQFQTVAAMETFFLAMCTHPHAQHAAQAELDNVIGNDRLPSMADRARLPYIEALMKEVIRWSPIAPMGELSILCHFILANVPLGIPHRLMQEDTYEGYKIPAGSIVMANIWYIYMHSPHAITHSTPPGA